MALRLGLFYTSASLSGAFGGRTCVCQRGQDVADQGAGLLARGLTSIGARGNEQEWSWIFIIEGLLVRSLPSMFKAGGLTSNPDVWRGIRGILPASQQRRDGALFERGGTLVRKLQIILRPALTLGGRWRVGSSPPLHSSLIKRAVTTVTNSSNGLKSEGAFSAFQRVSRSVFIRLVSDSL